MIDTEYAVRLATGVRACRAQHTLSHISPWAAQMVVHLFTMGQRVLPQVLLSARMLLAGLGLAAQRHSERVALCNMVESSDFWEF